MFAAVDSQVVMEMRCLQKAGVSLLGLEHRECPHDDKRVLKLGFEEIIVSTSSIRRT